jgi:hypothetical protein
MTQNATLDNTTTKFLDDSGMNYTVTKEPAIQRTTDANGVPQYNEVTGQFHLVRSTDKAVVSPKTVSGKYTPTNPRDMILPVAPLIAEGFVTPEKGHALSGGSHEILRFRIDGGNLPDKGKIVGEDWYHFFDVHNFQGAGAFFGNLYCYRLRCSNGAVSLVKKGGGFRLRHMGALQTKYEDAMRTWTEITEEIRKIGDRMTVWNDTQVSATEAVAILQDIYEVEDPAKIPTRTANELEFAIREFSNPQRGTNGRTLYDIFNAITATNTHYQPRNSRETESKRLSSLLNPNGSRNRLEARTVEILASI